MKRRSEHNFKQHLNPAQPNPMGQSARAKFYKNKMEVDSM